VLISSSNSFAIILVLLLLLLIILLLFLFSELIELFGIGVEFGTGLIFVTGEGIWGEFSTIFISFWISAVSFFFEPPNIYKYNIFFIKFIYFFKEHLFIFIFLNINFIFIKK